MLDNPQSALRPGRGSAPQSTDVEDLEDALGRIQCSADALVGFITGPMFTASLRRELRLASVSATSPWLTPEQVPAYCGRSADDLRRIAKTGALTVYQAGDGPRFLKSEVDQVIKEGRWPKAKAGKKDE